METRFGQNLVGPSKCYPKGNSENIQFIVQYISMKNRVNLLAGVSNDCPCHLKTDEEVAYLSTKNVNNIGTYLLFELKLFCLDRKKFFPFIKGNYS